MKSWKYFHPWQGSNLQRLGYETDAFANWATDAAWNFGASFFFIKKAVRYKVSIHLINRLINVFFVAEDSRRRK